MSRSSSRPGAPVRVGWISVGLAVAVAAVVVALAVALPIPATPGPTTHPGKVAVTDRTKVLNVQETGVDEPGRPQPKAYAHEVANVAVGAIGDEEREDLRLDRVGRLSPAAMAFVRLEVLKLAPRAARGRGDVHGRAPPVELDPTGPAAP